MTDRQSIYAAISRERDHQSSKWGLPHHSIGAWITVLRVELAEAELAWAKRPDDADALREILQVAAVAVAALEQHGVYER